MLYYVCKLNRMFTYADMEELEDSPDLGSGAKACRFESCYPHLLTGCNSSRRRTSTAHCRTGSAVDDIKEREFLYANRKGIRRVICVDYSQGT